MKVEDLIPIGTVGEQKLLVTDELTVGYSVPGMPMVFATPQMIHHMEVVSAASIAPLLPDECVSVGTRVDVEHLAATPVGFEVTTKSSVAAIDGPRVTFEVLALVGAETIGKGTHTRAVVEFDRFMDGMARKQQRRA